MSSSSGPAFFSQSRPAGRQPHEPMADATPLPSLDSSPSSNGQADCAAPPPGAASASEQKQVFVRRISDLMEECGHPCIAGRIVGWLVVSDPPEQSFGALVEATDASKGSISTMTRRLERAGLIERIRRTGDRQTYFRLRPDAWHTVLCRRMALVRDLAAAAERGLRELEDEPPSVRCRLEEMHDFYAFVAENMPALIEQYEEDSRQAHPSRSACDGDAEGRR